VSGPKRSDGSSNVHVNLSRLLAVALTGALFSLCAAVTAAAQVVPCDFDVADDLGHQFWGSAAHVAGRAGASSELADFLLINADKAEMDVDHDGFTQTACGYSNIFIPPALRTNLINISNAALAIPAANVVVTNLPQSLPAGTTARVGVYVEIPAGTPAGRYTGNFQIRDAVRGVSLGPNNEVLSVDIVYIDLTVLPDLSFNIISSDSAVRLDSLLIRARAGATGSSVFRVANTSNAPLTDVQISASDLRAESSTGLVIPKEAVRFTPPSFSSLLVNDTARVTVTVAVPRSVLIGRYRGSLLVQANGAPAGQIPLIVFVTGGGRALLFENNPVRAYQGDVARISFPGDPGTTFKLAVFDMTGLIVFSTQGTVFAGVGTGGNPPAPGQPPAPGADFAASVTWPLVNGRGNKVASGMYFVVVESIVAGQRELAKDRLMVIR